MASNIVYSITCYDQIDKCVQQVCDFDSEDGLSVALSYDYDFTKIEEMDRHICVPQNMHEPALALQALQTVPHDTGVIYPIMDSEWVAPILLVPIKRLELHWKKYKMILMRMQGFTKKRLRVFMTECLQERSFMLETKSFFIIRV